jgi:hypothetical protein
MERAQNELRLLNKPLEFAVSLKKSTGFSSHIIFETMKENVLENPDKIKQKRQY